MLLGTLKQSGRHQHNRLIFIILNAESHGLRRTEPQYYECDCGNELSPGELELGDRRKKSWPDCMSARHGGQKHCPVCGKRVAVSAEERARAKGYELIPEAKYDDITDDAREAAFDRYDRACIACDHPPDAVHRIVPPRYGGSGEPMNLVPLCETHRDRRGHQFLDVMMPWEWEEITAVDWESYVEDLRDQYAAEDSQAAERIVELCEDMLDQGKPKNPNPYADSRLEETPHVFEIVEDEELQSISDVVTSLDGKFDAAGAPESAVVLVLRERFEMSKETAQSRIDVRVEQGELYRKGDDLLKAV